MSTKPGQLQVCGGQTGGVEDRFAFRCRSGRLGDSLRAGLLGGYSGSGSWSIFVEEIADADEHMVVQVHEALHHELQVSSIWGQITALSALLAEGGHRPLALSEVFDHGVIASTAVHEMYATFLADATLRKKTHRDVLEGNSEYSGYRDRAVALLPTEGVSDQIRIGATAAVLRALMQPRSLVGLVEKLDFSTLRAADIRRHVPVGPDARLDVLERVSQRVEWAELLADLDRLDPRHQERILGENRPTEAEDMALLQEQWDFEVQEVQRRCHELVSEQLGSTDSGCLPWAELRNLAEAVRSAVVLVDPSLAEVLAIGDDLPVDNADVLEFARQRIVLREPMVVEEIGSNAQQVLAALEGFVVQAGTGDEHVLGIWADPGFLRKQFSFEGPLGPDPTTVLFTRASTGVAGGSVARVGNLRGLASPRELQRQLGDVPLIALTSHLSLVREEVATTLDAVEPVFVWMDLPIGWHVDHWLSQGASVRFAVATVDRERELAMLGMQVDRAPHLRFIHIGGLLAMGSLFERLRQRHGEEQLSHDQSVISDEGHGFTLVARHIVNTFSTLDQDGES